MATKPEADDGRLREVESDVKYVHPDEQDGDAERSTGDERFEVTEDIGDSGIRYADSDRVPAQEVRHEHPAPEPDRQPTTDPPEAPSDEDDGYDADNNADEDDGYDDAPHSDDQDSGAIPDDSDDDSDGAHGEDPSDESAKSDGARESVGQFTVSDDRYDVDRNGNSSSTDGSGTNADGYADPVDHDDEPDSPSEPYEPGSSTNTGDGNTAPSDDGDSDADVGDGGPVGDSATSFGSGSKPEASGNFGSGAEGGSAPAAAPTLPDHDADFEDTKEESEYDVAFAEAEIEEPVPVDEKGDFEPELDEKEFGLDDIEEVELID